MTPAPEGRHKFSPGRKPWVENEIDRVPQGRQRVTKRYPLRNRENGKLENGKRKREKRKEGRGAGRTTACTGRSPQRQGNAAIERALPQGSRPGSDEGIWPR